MGGMLHLTQSGIQHAIQSYQADVALRHRSVYTSDQLDQFRRAAVMIPMFEYNNDWHILLTQRSDTVEDHRGQVAFPGGAREKEDKDLSETALREMQEEIGVKPEDVDIFGHLGDMSILTGFLVRIYVGRIPWPYEIKIAREEVKSVFSIPIPWLADSENHHIQFRNYAGREVPVIFFDYYDGYQLWGASAEMTLGLLKALNLSG